MPPKKLVFFIVWFFLLSLAPITVFSNTPISLAFSDPVVLVNTFQRLFGLMAFTLIFIQIVLGSFMTKLTEKLGGWVFSFHTTQGLFTYALVFLHPLLFVILNYLTKHVIDPFYVFTDLCVLCSNKLELYYNFGRISFWLLTATVTAAFFRTHPFLRLHWRKIHVLNYVVFFLIWYHSLKVGSDIGTFPFSFFHGPALVIILGFLFYRFFGYLRGFKGSQ